MHDLLSLPIVEVGMSTTEAGLTDASQLMLL